jgi:hypothetical protein
MLVTHTHRPNDRHRHIACIPGGQERNLWQMRGAEMLLMLSNVRAVINGEIAFNQRRHPEVRYIQEVTLFILL